MEAYSEPSNAEEFEVVGEKALLRKDDLKYVDGLVYKGSKLYVPSSKRREVIEELHSSSRAGHAEIAATKLKVEENYWWPTIYGDVEKYIKSCEMCMKAKSDRSKDAGHSFRVNGPGYIVAIDCMGPIAQSTAGNVHVIVAIDMFTRFVEDKAVKDTLTEIHLVEKMEAANELAWFDKVQELNRRLSESLDELAKTKQSYVVVNSQIMPYLYLAGIIAATTLVGAFAMLYARRAWQRCLLNAATQATVNSLNLARIGCVLLI